MPNIYAVSPRLQRVGWIGRLVAAALAGGCLSVLLLAATLTPSPDGTGTHQHGLGLPACNFLLNTRLPCPACGMTTSFAWMARGNVVASFYVQPMGAVLAILSAATVCIGSYVAFTARPAHRLLRLLPQRYTLIPLLVFGILAWGWKILIHLNGMDGWGH